MTTTKTHDNLNRLLRVDNVIPSESRNLSFAYEYNDANQRTRRTDEDGSYWDYGYDSLGQVTSGHRKWQDTTAVAGQQYDYSYDDIGNRKTTIINSHTGTYTANGLNQYTQRVVPDYVTELGSATNAATVTINNQPTSRHGEYFSGELAVNNASSAVYTQLTTVAVLKNAGSNQMDIVSSVTGKVFLAQSPEIFGYDSDGNLTNDGRWAYSWDAENRLLEAESLINAPTASKRKVEWTYDHQGRQIRQTTYDGSSGSYVMTNDLKFVFDGWQCVAELNATNNAVMRSYVWGLDLSGTTTGAGGVGGLLMMDSAASGAHLYAYDGNGNVTVLVNASDGAVSATYEYSPFGESLRATGLLARENPFRFSTKRVDSVTGLVSYEYRFYQPNSAKWLTRDPQFEDGFRLIDGRKRIEGLLQTGARSLQEILYGFVNNDPIQRIDFRGLYTQWWSNARENCCGAKVAGRKWDLIHTISQDAYGQAQRKRKELAEMFPQYDRGKDEERLENAYRHCLWACKVTRALNSADKAWQLEECHELYGEDKWDAVDTATDRHNNRVGNRLGSQSNGNCGALCVSALGNGDLVVRRNDPRIHEGSR